MGRLSYLVLGILSFLFHKSTPVPEDIADAKLLSSDTLIVSADVLDHIKQLIIEAEAWRFKDSYHPRVETMPDTELFKKVREYLEEIFEKEKDK